MRSIAFYGKGGSGKTTLSTSLSVLLARDGLKVLLLGCDPKHDTTYALVKDGPRVNLIDELKEAAGSRVDPGRYLMRGTDGIDCVEAGGPEPGVGCAGRGITLMLETLTKEKIIPGSYDCIVYDVLGDVVCGGFAAPIRLGHAKEVYIIISGEVLSLYAANNLSRALRRYQEVGVKLAGFVANLRGVPGEAELLERFAAMLGSRCVGTIPRDQAVHKAHVGGRTVVELFPDSTAGLALSRFKDAFLASEPDQCVTPTPLTDEQFEEFIRSSYSSIG